MADIFTTLSFIIQIESTDGQIGIVTLDWREHVPGSDPWNTNSPVFGAGGGEWSGNYIARRVQIYGTLPANTQQSWLATLDGFPNPRDLSIGFTGAGLWYPTSTPMPSGVISWTIMNII